MMLLSDNKIRDIDLAGRHILERVGLKILDQGFLERLKHSGCQVDLDSQIVRFPEAFLDQTLSKAPSQFTLYSRDGEHDLDVGAGNVYFGNGGRVFQVLDTATGECRPTVLKDIAQTANLVNDLEHINFYIIACQAHDLDPKYYHMNDFFYALNYTTKHVMGGCDTLDGVKQVWELISFLAEGEKKFRQKPFVSIITNPISPLTVDRATLQILEFCSVRGIPVTFAPAPIAGVTAPVSLSGALAQMHAEALAGVALSQFFLPGAKVMYGSVPMAMDLRNMNLTTGSVEAAMMNAVAVRLARLYHLPIYASAGLTESKSSDLQAGLEKAISCLLVGLAGADYIHLAAGILDSGNSISYEQYVIDDEILGMIHRILASIDVNEDILGISSIEKIGPGGSFVTEDHTVKYMLHEYFYPKLAVRSNFDQWEGNNRPTLFSRAAARVQEWRDNHGSVLGQDLISKIRMKFPQIVDL